MFVIPWTYIGIMCIMILIVGWRMYVAGAVFGAESTINILEREGYLEEGWDSEEGE